MADLQLIIDVVGEQDMVKAIRTANRMKNEYKLLDSTFNDTHMSAQAYAKGVAQLDKKYDSLIAKTKALSKVQQTNNKAIQQAARKTNQLGVLLQQTGYQVGDFAVQVQSGTNYMVAFGQQATQLVGTFAMLAKSTRMIALFSGLGIAVPILTAIGAYFVRAAESADDATQEVKSFSDAISDSQSSIDRAKTSMDILGTQGLDTLREKYGALTKEVRGLADALTDIEIKAMSLEVQGAMETLFSPEFFRQVTSELGNVGAAIVETTDEDLAYMQAQLKSFEDQVKNFPHLAPDYAEVIREMREEIAAVTGDLENMGSLTDELKVPAESLATFKQLRATIEQATREENFLAAANGISEMRSLMESLGIEVDSGAIANMTRLEDKLRQAVSTTSAAVNAATGAANVAQAAFDRLQKQKVMMSRASGDERAAIEQQVTAQLIKAQEAYLKAIEDSHKAGKDLSKLNLKSPFVDALPAARMLAYTMGIALEDALSFINLASQDSGPVGAGRGKSAGAGSTAIGRSMLGMGGEFIPSSSNKPNKGIGGGVSANVVNIEDVIAARERQIKQERVLIGLSGKQRAAQEIYYDLLKQNEDADKKLTEAELHGAAKAIAAQEEQNRVLKEAKEQQNDLAQGIADSMGDAFMSVVDGTKSVKDAFKDMARAIIKQLFEVLVVQRLVGTVGSGNVAGSGLAGLLSGTLASANGNVFSGGSHVKAYANGGVVGGPTFFPMTGGKTGLMGEAGPEAIMPLKRGPNGKLGVQAEGGSQGNVVVNQSFNFQANGDDSVKRIIAEAAPRIADLTQRQIMDSRRRGGSMKATFG